VSGATPPRAPSSATCAAAFARPLPARLQARQGAIADSETTPQRLAAATAAEAEADGMSVLTYNILAPCYFRAGRSMLREASFEAAWVARHRKIASAVARVGAGIVMLQEFWFDPAFVAYYEGWLGGAYAFQTLQRTRHKSDGVATLLDERHYAPISTKPLRFDDSGDRVALLSYVRAVAAADGAADGDGDGDSAPPLLAVNTHLTYPHGDFDKRMRADQAKKICAGVVEYLDEVGAPPDTTVVLGGDFNGEAEDAVYGYLVAHGYSSTFAQVHGREVVCSHCDHHSAHTGVDFIFTATADGLRRAQRGDGGAGDRPEPALQAVASLLLPVGTPDHHKMARPVVKAPEAGAPGPGAEARAPIPLHDAPPLPAAMSEFADISDHRPLVTQFRRRG